MARKPRHRDLDAVAGDEPFAEDEPSRSARKRASHELKRLGAELIELKPERLAALPLPERLLEAIAEARRLTSFGARRRQAQFVGRLMRQLDEEALAAVRGALQR
jgi:ribosome-associated protein